MEVVWGGNIIWIVGGSKTLERVEEACKKKDREWMVERGCIDEGMNT